MAEEPLMDVGDERVVVRGGGRCGPLCDDDGV